MAVAADRGIPLITAHATSTYTQRIYANDGFDVAGEVIYKDYLVGKEFINTPQIVYRVTAYRVNAGYRVDFFKNQIIWGIFFVQIVCL